MPMSKKTVLFGVLGVIVGLAVGMAWNMGLVGLNMAVHPPLEGFDWSNPTLLEEYMASMPVLGFLIVLLAHSGQAFFGSLVGTLISGRRSMIVGMIIGALTLVGCVFNLQTIPAPTWFAVVDVALPIPVAYLAFRLLRKTDE